MDKWEYLTGSSRHSRVEIDAYPRKKEYELNELGQKGWELAGTFSTGDVIFKRRIPDSPTQTQASAQNTSRQPEVDMGLTF